MIHTPHGLGLAIRAAREELDPPMTQRALGEMAGYSRGASAGVSISRVEAGQMMPRPERLAAIASALGTEVEALRARASRLSGDRNADEASEGRSPELPTTSPRSPERMAFKARVRHLQGRLDDRTTAAARIATDFNAAHDQARDHFFLPFVAAAAQVVGPPAGPPAPDALGAEDLGDTEAVSRYRIELSANRVATQLGGLGGGVVMGAGVGSAAAYGAYVAAAMYGTASTGVAISGLSGAAASSATLAWLGGGSLAAGGAGVAGGTALLTGVVAAPAAFLAIGGYLLMARRNKRREAELHVKLDELERGLDDTALAFEAVSDLAAEATGVLEYVALHGGHALTRWRRQLPKGPCKLNALQAEQYSDFLLLAGAQVSVATLDLGRLMTLDGDDLDAAATSLGDTVEFSRSMVETLV